MALLTKGYGIATKLQEAFSRPLAALISQVPCGSNFHTCSVLERKKAGFPEPKKWLTYNDVVYPPTPTGEPLRPAEITHQRINIKYSPKKMWFLACMIRGMSIDEALKQMSFQKRKGAVAIKEALLEAQEIAVKEHNVEFQSNLWVADSYVGKAMVIKGLRKHMGPRYGLVRYRYVHYFVRLREGRPPKHYYHPMPDGNEKLQQYLSDQRARRIEYGL